MTINSKSAERNHKLSIKSVRLCVTVVKAAALILLLPIFGVKGRAQLGKGRDIPSATYDVASIRPFGSDSPNFQSFVPSAIHTGNFRAVGVTVRLLLQLAHGVQENQIQGAPPWVNTDLYSINAKADPLVDQQLRVMSDEDAKLTKQHMLQALLSDRFQLRAQTTTRAGIVSELMVAKGGSKLQPSKPSGAGIDSNSGFNMHFEGETMIFRQASIHSLIDFLSRETKEEITDNTGLSGKYDFSLRFNQERHGIVTDLNGLSLYDALTAQLGLKIRSQKGKVKELVVQYIARPSAN